MNPSFDVKLTRRDLLITGAVSTAGAASASLPSTAQAMAAPAAPEKISKQRVAFEVNGKPVTLEVDTRTTLLDALREHLKLTGTKKGCDHGQCGACTALVDGRRINACLSFAVMHEGSKVTTIEGLGQPRQPASDAGRLRQARRLSVRLLHAGADLLGGGGAGRDQAGVSQPCHRRS